MAEQPIASATSQDSTGAGGDDDPVRENGDWHLCDLISLVNDLAGGSVGITLFVGGSLVSGQLIGGREYFQAFGTQFTAGMAPDQAAAITETYRRRGDEVYGVAEHAEDPEMAPQVPTYVHLRDAHVIAAGTPVIPQNQGLLWRGRVSSVDGWSLGVMSDDAGDADT